MRISSLKNLAKRAAADQHSRWRSSAYPVSGVSAQSQFLQQCRCYYSRSHSNQLSTTRVSNAPFCHLFPFLRKSYSSSSSSNSKKGVLAWYLGMLDSRPILTKSISSGLIYAAADSTSQMITMSPSDSLDNIRVLRMASFGLLILGPVQHAWFNLLGRKLPRRDVATTLKKLVLGQLVLGPCITGTFFSFNASLQGESGKEIAARLKRDLLPTLMSGLMYWPVCDFLTYKVIPVHLQPLMNSSCSYIWTIYLTYMASLKKAVTD
ncbi:PREDICTED: PXMP2/4 family protein 4-like [Ipomoea nil]|uniref:PXMP2/4 family protein 4-like n=1 Tax=Ipomoea nil TaxID=35883 RepID=UPI0009018091|nr:PREDICTED: PXMP2/4 family protein 4-like [Ipomoea nil]